MLKKYLIAIICLLFLQLAYANPQAVPDNWPCVQRYVPELSVAVIWSGPLDEVVDEKILTDSALSELASALANSRVNFDGAKVRTDTYLSQHPGKQEALVTQLFSRIFAKIQKERTRVIKGIFRYTDRQRMLGKRIGEQRKKLEDTSSQSLDATEREDLEARQTWDIRALRERERQLNYLCEQPVKLEQRLFKAARYLQGYLQG